MSRSARRWMAIAACTALAACASAQSTLPGFVDQPSRIGLTLADERPADDKTSDILSVSISSCKYAIRRLGDETSDPAHLVLLRHDLEEALGARLAGKIVHVKRYAVYWNNRITVQADWMFAPPTTASVMDTLTLGQICTPQEMGESWVEPTPDLVNNPPLVVIVAVTIDGKDYSVHGKYVPTEPIHITEPTGQIFLALHQANGALADRIAGR